MKKLLLLVILTILSLCTLFYVVWANRANIAAFSLSRKLGVSVTIDSLAISRTEADIQRVWIGTPKRSKTKTSFSAENTAIVSNFQQLTGNPMIIEEIDVSNIFVGVEYYTKEETNWSYILRDTGPKKKKAKERGYLIRTLVLRNLTVVVTQPDGKSKKYPTIDRMEFHNISSESGFPIEEIEKEIFRLMMQDLFQRFNFDQLLKQFPFSGPGGGSPLRYWPLH